VVAVLSVAITGWKVTIGTLTSAICSLVAYRGANAVSMPIIEGVVAVVVVVVIINGPIVMMIPSPSMVVPIRIVIIPSPTIAEAIVIPSVIVIVRTVIITWPPPVVTHVNA
jgi:hypothetical protein